MILSGLVGREKYASARKSATMSATGGFLIDAQASIMKTQIQAREIWKAGQKKHFFCKSHMPASSKVAWDSDLQKDVVLPNTNQKKISKTL